MLSSDRGEIAERWRDCAHISRKEIFGFADEKCAPKHLLDDAALALSEAGLCLGFHRRRGRGHA